MAPSSFCERREALGQLDDMVGSWLRWKLALIKLRAAWEALELTPVLELTSRPWGWGQELGGACDPCKGPVSGADGAF